VANPSRSAFEALRRLGLIAAPGQGPRINLSDFLVHTIPLAAPRPSTPVLQELEGEPSPDRGETQAWPVQT
jgi:hypothetical protein